MIASRCPYRFAWRGSRSSGWLPGWLPATASGGGPSGAFRGSLYTVSGGRTAMSENTETAILAGGCFWLTQELLRHRDGVISTRVGYTGGENDNPTAGHHTGHAEAVEV